MEETQQLEQENTNTEHHLKHEQELEEQDQTTIISQNDSCDFNPDFAVICSFISLFGDKIDVNLDIEQLKYSIEDQESLDEGLIDLHVKLLRKIRRYLVRDQWERVLISFASEYSYQDAYEIEQLGYLKTRPSIKLQLLRRLLDAQFEYDSKFKSTVNLSNADELRLLPIGRDIKGNSYWHHSDSQSNFRVFQEEPLNHKSWKTVCKTAPELKQLIDELENSKDTRIKGEPPAELYNPLPEIYPEYFEEKKSDDDTNQTKRTNGRGVKKGKNKRRGKKCTPLAVVKEEVESIDYKTQSSVLNGTNFSSKIAHSKIGQFIDSNSDTNQTIESQVSIILSDVINSVASTIGSISATLFEPFKKGFKNDAKDVDIPIKIRKKAAKREKPKIDELPRRSSSRLQQLQQKKEEEMKKMIESKTIDANPTYIDPKDGSSRDSFSKRQSESPENSVKSNRRRKKNKQGWRRGKSKKKLSWDKDDSDLSSTSSPTESNDDFDEELKFENHDDDEFACEEEETNSEPVIIKRARTARQDPDETGELNESYLIEQDKPCGRCDKSHDPERILLCDMCDDGFHLECCIPPLMAVPDGDWYCPSCEHKMLLIKLEDLYSSIMKILEARERERQKKKKLRQNQSKVESTTTSVHDNEVKGKRRRDLLHELNDPIALQELDEDLKELPSSHREPIYERPKKKTSRSKRNNRSRRRNYDDDDEIAFRIDSRRSHSRRRLSDSDETNDEASFESTSSESSQDVQQPRTRKARACVSYRFQEYDELIKSAIRGDSEPDDVPEESAEESDSEKCNYGRGKDMATIEALAYQQENGLTEQGETEQEVTQPVAVQSKSKPRKKGRRLNDLDAESEIDSATSDESFQASATEAEEEEEDELTELESEDDTSTDEIVSYKNYSRNKKLKKKKRRRRRSSYESDDSDFEPRTRRAAAKRVSYNESTDEEDEDFFHQPRKLKKTILSSGAESEASWKASVKSDSDGVADNNEVNDSEDTLTRVESEDELINNSIVCEAKQEPTIIETSIKNQTLVESKSSDAGIDEEIRPGPKKIRLEKRETRPVYNPDLIDKSTEVIAAKLAQPPSTVATNIATSHVARPLKSAKSQPQPPQPTSAPPAPPAPAPPPPSQTLSKPSLQTPSKPPPQPPMVQLNQVVSIERPPAPPIQLPRHLSPVSIPQQMRSPIAHPVQMQHQSPRPMYPHPHPQQPPPPYIQHQTAHLSPYHHPTHLPYGPPPPPPPHGPMMHSPYLPAGLSPHSAPPLGPPVNSYIPHQGPPAPYMIPQPMMTNLTSPRSHPMPPSTHKSSGLPPPHVSAASMIRNPIHDLNQYCTGSTYPSSIFSSFNISMPPKNAPPSLPSFYDEDEVRPKNTPPSEKQKTNWNPTS